MRRVTNVKQLTTNGAFNRREMGRILPATRPLEIIARADIVRLVEVTPAPVSCEFLASATVSCWVL